MFETYTVKKGDCLWNIARSRYDDALFWPSLYSFNNWAAANHIQHAGFITDPNLIYPGQKILLPDLDVTLLRPILNAPKLAAAIRRADARAAGKPATPAFTAEPLVLSPAQVARNKRANPAAYLGFKPFLAFEYDFDDLPPTTYVAPGFTAEIKWSGNAIMQPVHDTALITLSNHGAMLAHEFKANNAFGDFATKPSVAWKPGDKHPAFACDLTRAGHGPIPEIAVENDAEGPKFVLTWKLIHGCFQGYDFVASASAEITIKPKETGGTPNSTNSPISRNVGSIPSKPTTTIASAAPRSVGMIPRQRHSLIASNPHHFSWPKVKPSGVAPLVGGTMIGGILAFIIANPEWLALAVVA
ncbi:LysM peptidoglycan-binding domain-containing protein [Acidiphilium sp. PA]|uniref:LysM peptidoglycan-binding domain-containing protein n=1 Tax=Acidiphilium sp. PA TaxID=2871705 RepID=UPI002243C52B|nr:LysM domain-containing protein [Acidiphilium sp. PA]MCW8308824.1 LysM peptidoglycan-binding domain-containing protein [Acidiphilium sp. PA]